MARFKPHKPGTLVLGRIADLRIRTVCADHVWTVHHAVRAPHGNESGWLQSATCLIDGYTTPPMDATWWAALAEPKHLRIAIRECLDTASDLRATARYMHKRLRKMSDSDAETD